MPRKSSLAYKSDYNCTPHARVTTRIGIIGAGYWAPKFSRSFNDMAGTRVVAICDINPTKMRPFRAVDPEIGCYGDYRDLISNSAIDAVVISIADPERYAVAEAAMRNNIHVIVQECDSATEEQVTSLMNTATETECNVTIVSLPSGGTISSMEALPESVANTIDEFMVNIK